MEIMYLFFVIYAKENLILIIMMGDFRLRQSNVFFHCLLSDLWARMHSASLSWSPYYCILIYFTRQAPTFNSGKPIGSAIMWYCIIKNTTPISFYNVFYYFASNKTFISVHCIEYFAENSYVLYKECKTCSSWILINFKLN